MCIRDSYTVNRLDDGVMAKAFVSAAKAQMGDEGGVTPFDVSLGDVALGFNVSLGRKTMARVFVASGQSTISVVSTATDPAKAKAVALEAARRLLAVAR